MQFRLPIRLFLVLARYRRAMTLGVRAVVLDEKHQVLLIRHSYAPGWHFPGGGVEPRETLRDSLARELEEEAGVVLTSEPRLHGVFLNRRYSQRDHVTVFVCREWKQAHPPAVPNLEILECRFFPLDALPEGTTDATRRRLAEIIGGAPPSPDW
ncbi:MAG TPA: NUDIX domain-containing protein [Bauldia sp.]